MSNKLIDEIKSIINKYKDNSPDMLIDSLSKTLCIDIIDEEKEEVKTIYEIDLKTLFNSILDNNLELEWF